MNPNRKLPLEGKHPGPLKEELERERWRWECRALLAESRAVEAERQLESMSTAMRDVYLMFDVSDQRLVTLTPAFERLSGRSVASAHEDLETFLSMFRAEDRERAQSVLHGCSEDPWQRFLIDTPDGSVRAVRWEMSACPGFSQRTHGLIVRVARGSSLRGQGTLHAGPGFEERLAS